jgi:DNA-binding NtrC family response regulator
MAKILIVDDEELILEFLEFELEEWGHEVTKTTFPKKALDMVSNGFIPDLIISDITMPEMNGGELLTACKNLHPEVPFILISGFSRLDLSKMKAMGAFEVIEKPIDMKALQQSVEKALQKSP